MGKEQHPGSFALDDVMDLGKAEHFDLAEGISKRLQFDDIMNIQFTSVNSFWLVYVHTHTHVYTIFLDYW